jgi:glycolate oxidase FAD binding subunit
VSLTWRADRLLVGLQGGAAGLDERVGRVRELLGEQARALDGPVVDEQPAGGQVAALRIGCLPSKLPDLLDGLPARAATAELGTGVATVALPPDAVDEAHRRVHAAGGSAVLRDRPADCTAPAWGPPPSSVGVLRAVKRALDPTGRLGPGRFAPWM